MVPPHVVQAFGLGNIALNVIGHGNQVSAGNEGNFAITESSVPAGTPSTLGLAFNTIGNNNTTTAIGPLAVAGSLFKNNLNGANQVVQLGPGIALNRNRIGAATTATTTAATDTSTPVKRIGATQAGAINKTVAGVTKRLHIKAPG